MPIANRPEPEVHHYFALENGKISSKKPTHFLLPFYYFLIIITNY
jgi:hypothetical protein